MTGDKKFKYSLKNKSCSDVPLICHPLPTSKVTRVGDYLLVLDHSRDSCTHLSLSSHTNR